MVASEPAMSRGNLEKVGAYFREAKTGVGGARFAVAVGGGAAGRESEYSGV
jgi:hypothetical protein